MHGARLYGAGAVGMRLPDDVVERMAAEKAEAAAQLAAVHEVRRAYGMPVRGDYPNRGAYRHALTRWRKGRSK